MPYQKPIIVTAEHAAKLRELGPGSLLVWHEPSGEIGFKPPVGLLSRYMMIIAPHSELERIADRWAGDEEPVTVTDACFAESLTVTANELAQAWPTVRTLTSMIMPVRRLLDHDQVYVCDAPVYTRFPDQLPELTDVYAQPDGCLTVQVTYTFAFAAPTRIAVFDPAEEAKPVLELALDTSEVVTEEATAALIARTVTTALTLGDR